jgi:hypothetical protein
MRKILLSGAALLGASSGLAVAQAPLSGPNQSQGQYAAPLVGGPAANNNLNTFGTAAPGPALAPSPGTVVIRLNGKVYADADLSYGTGLQTAPHTIVPASGAASNTAGYKLNPVGVASYFRLYPGIDGAATNGLRYGAAVEIRENFEGGNNFSVTAANVSASGAAPAAGGSFDTTLPSGTATSGTNASASGVSSGQTLFVRRAFVYLGSDQAGILRIGQGDGLVSIYDATGIFTTGSWDGGIGNLNNAGFQAQTPNQYLISWPFLSGNGVEYGNNKVVYLSPSFFGFDAGFEYGPNQGNILTDSATSDPYAVGPCNTASANCIAVTSGTDSSRWINRWGFGGRYIGTFAGATLQGYGEYIVSGKANVVGGGVQASPANLKANPAVGPGLAGGGTAAGSIKYDGQNFFVGGVAATYLGITFNADFSAGRTNGSNAMDSHSGVPMHAELAGLSYSIGPIAFGIIGAIIDSQGSVQLTNTSQRHEVATAVGGVYKIAPGLNLAAEYQYEQKHQGGFNFNTSANGVSTGNDIHGQGLTFAAIVNW